MRKKWNDGENTCGWEAALTLAKWNDVGSARFWTSIPMWRQNEHQKSFPLLTFRDSSWRLWPIKPWWAVSTLNASCYLWRPIVEKNLYVHFVFTWAWWFKGLHSQHCSILQGLCQNPSHMWKVYIFIIISLLSSTSILLKRAIFCICLFAKVTNRF